MYRLSLEELKLLLLEDLSSSFSKKEIKEGMERVYALSSTYTQDIEYFPWDIEGVGRRITDAV